MLCTIKSRAIYAVRSSVKNCVFHTSSYLGENHYEILKLDPTCTDKDIRDAFISLSKQYHPDANKNNKDSHSKFIKINEAYTVLSKPLRRSEYDFFLKNIGSMDRNSWEIHTNSPNAHVWKDESLWYMRDKSKDGPPKYYYGIKGINKVSNKLIVFLCLLLTSVGVGLQVLAIRNSMTMSRELMEKRSVENSKTHTVIRRQAEINGNEIQLELMRQRLMK